MPFPGSQWGDGIMGIARAAKPLAPRVVQFNCRGAAPAMTEVITPRSLTARILVAASKIKNDMENIATSCRPGRGKRQAESVVFTPIGHLHAKLSRRVDI